MKVPWIKQRYLIGREAGRLHGRSRCSAHPERRQPHGRQRQRLRLRQRRRHNAVRSHALPPATTRSGSDGGVFVFGSPTGLYGSLPGLGIHVKNIVGIVATADGGGYYLVGNDGGVFAFGDSPYIQSLPGTGVHVSRHRRHRRHAWWMTG